MVTYRELSNLPFFWPLLDKMLPFAGNGIHQHLQVRDCSFAGVTGHLQGRGKRGICPKRERGEGGNWGGGNGLQKPEGQQAGV